MRSLKFDIEVRRRILILKRRYKIRLANWFILLQYMDILHKQTVGILIKYSTISFKIRK